VRDFGRRSKVDFERDSGNVTQKLWRSEEATLDDDRIVKLLYSLDQAALSIINRYLSKYNLDDTGRLIINKLYFKSVSISEIAFSLKISSEIVEGFVLKMENEGIVKRVVTLDEEMISLSIENLFGINESLPELYSEMIKNYFYE
jgi:hypothetical protein